MSWHATCLKCAQCNRTLAVGSINDRNGKVYCKNCYSSVAGLKGFGHGTSSESSVSGGASGKATYSNAPVEQESALAKGFSDGYGAGNVNPQGVHTPNVPQPNLDPALLPVPRIHQQQHGQVQSSPSPAPTQAPSQAPSVHSTGLPQSAPTSSVGQEGYTLANDGDWAYFDINLALKATGKGAAALRQVLPVSECGFAYWRIVRANVGNSGADVITEANVVLQYKGPSTNAIKKVKSNTALDAAQKKCPAPYKGFLEVLTNGPNLTDEAIFDRWKPGSGSKVIDN
uniref:LIM zinc-binding domain-containing protein n=1 Tax=Arcella intermedia TaxID=1963864 RepID=A0A6B2LBU6_9EUKA